MLPARRNGSFRSGVVGFFIDEVRRSPTRDILKVRLASSHGGETATGLTRDKQLQGFPNEARGLDNARKFLRIAQKLVVDRYGCPHGRPPAHQISHHLMRISMRAAIDSWFSLRHTPRQLAARRSGS